MECRTMAVWMTMLLLLAGCGPQESQLHTSADSEEPGSGDHGSDAAAPSHGEVHEFRFGGDETDRLDFEAGAELRSQSVTPQQAFVGVKAMVTAPKLDLEYRVVRADGDASEWTKLQAEQTHDKFHAGYFNLDRPAVQLEFRADTPNEYVRFEFFDEPVATIDAIDDHGHGAEPDDGVRRQELAKPGRYRPPASVRSAGAAQRGNFSYDSAPPYNGGRNCSGTFRPGARSLGNFLVDHFGGAAYYQGYNCRRIRGSSGMSMHGTGRAIDVFVPRDTRQPYHNQADNDLGDPIANYLIKNATELGVQFFIWDRTKWNISYGEDRSYGGSHPHHNHLHIELTKEAASQSRSRFPGQGPQFNPHFADDDASVHEEAINKIYEHGVTRGCRGGSTPAFCPGRTVRRANLAVMFMRAFNLPRASQDYFDDDAGSYAEPAINAMAYRGITTGCDPNRPRKFCPDGTVTRGQLAVFLDGALRLDDTHTDYYGDDDGEYYEPAANRLAAAGITNGCSPGRYCGSEPINRGQLASFLARAMGLLAGYDTQETDFVPYFADDDGSPHEESINLLYEEGVVHGCDSNSARPKFCPGRDLTRGALAAMAARGFELPAATDDHFDDDGGVLESVINAVAEAGLTHGCGGANYCPDRASTLGELAIFLMRGADYYSGGQVDAAGMSQEDAVEALVRWNVINRPSCSQPADCVGDRINRAQGAALFARVLSTIGAF